MAMVLACVRAEPYCGWVCICQLGQEYGDYKDEVMAPTMAVMMITIVMMLPTSTVCMMLVIVILIWVPLARSSECADQVWSNQ